jgi:phosphomannomutase
MRNAIASISGIRGVFNESLLPSDINRYVVSFAALVPGKRFLVGRDTRSTGDVISRLVFGALLGKGADVVDYGVLSTPALFRESRTEKVPAVMITASHNEPDWNGLKFIIDGRGIIQPELERILETGKRSVTKGGKRLAEDPTGRLLLGPAPSYNSELVKIAGEGSGDGVKVVIDINGGAAVYHAPAILERLGCLLTALGGTPGLFNRTVDPTGDGLQLLSQTVKEKAADVGFAFDCDGDRLVLVDADGRKRTGDYMLTLALKELLPSILNRSVVVSVDTTQAIDEVVGEVGGTVYRSKVGEANVIAKMAETGSRLGGEGSSGGLIDGEFNSCRDSMLAAITIVMALKKKGTKVFDRVRSYSQVRLKVAMDRRKAMTAIKKLQKEHPEADSLDGFKMGLSGRSWVLVRPSGTEDVVRVSAESTSQKEAEEVAHSFLKEVKRFGA